MNGDLGHKVSFTSAPLKFRDPQSWQRADLGYWTLRKVGQYTEYSTLHVSTLHTYICDRIPYLIISYV